MLNWYFAMNNIYNLDDKMQAEYRFRFSEDHLLTSFLRYQKQIWWRLPFLGLKWILAIVFGLSFIIFAYKGYLDLAAIFGTILGTLLLSGLIGAWTIRRRFRKSPFHNDEIVFSISESGSHVVGRDSEVSIGWASFTKARRFDDGLLLFQGPDAFSWLPDTAAINQTAIGNVQQLARKHIQDYRDV
jgi:hypothetical protein